MTVEKFRGAWVRRVAAAAGAGLVAAGGLILAGLPPWSAADPEPPAAERPSAGVEPASAQPEPRTGDVEAARKKQRDTLVSVSTAPIRVESAAAERKSAPATTFESPAAELRALEGRMAGENLTLEQRNRSLTKLRRLLAGELAADTRVELERRAVVLEAKQREQAKRVRGFEQRIEELRRL